LDDKLYEFDSPYAPQHLARYPALYYQAA